MLGMLLAAFAATAILAGPGVAAKPSNSVSCSSSTTIVMYAGGAFAVDLTWKDAYGFDAGVGQGAITGGPGSVSFNTPANAVTVSVLISYKNGTGARLAPASCL